MTIYVSRGYPDGLIRVREINPDRDHPDSFCWPAEAEPFAGLCEGAHEMSREVFLTARDAAQASQTAARRQRVASSRASYSRHQR